MSYQTTALALSAKALALNPDSHRVSMTAGGGGGWCDLFDFKISPEGSGLRNARIEDAGHDEIEKIAKRLCLELIIETSHSFRDEGADISVDLIIPIREIRCRVSSRGDATYIEKRSPISDFPWLAAIAPLAVQSEFEVFCRCGNQDIESSLAQKLSEHEESNLLELAKAMTTGEAWQEDFCDITVQIRKKQIRAFSVIMRDGPEFELNFDF